MTNSNSAPKVSRFPTFVRVFHSLVSWRTLGRVLVVVGALATLVVLFYAEENVRGKHAWNQYRQQLEARGEKLDFWAYVPPPVPDDQNFAMTPFLAPLFDFNPKPLEPGQSLWRDTNGFQRANGFAKELDMGDPYAWIRGQFTDFQALIVKPKGKATAAKTSSTRAESAGEVMQILKKYDDVLDELRTASQRPHARFNVKYTNEFAPSTLLPHLNVVNRVASAFQVRASAELALNQTDAAWSDIRMALYMADTVKDEPFLISESVRNALVQRSLQPVWEGLVDRKWSETQLREMEQRLGQIAILTPNTLRGELAYTVLTLDQMRKQTEIEWCTWTLPFTDTFIPHFLVPNGWYYQNQRTIIRTYEEQVLPVIDLPQRVFPAKAVANEEAIKREFGGGFTPYRFLVKMFLLGDNKDITLFDVEQRFARGQTRVNQAIVACALERYRLANGQFPETLNAISPQYLEKMPLDVITGEPLKYRRTTDGQFVLYSVGWDEKDDGGIMGGMTKDKTPKMDIMLGDWVWQYPAK
jgi:hypothetical protein